MKNRITIVIAAIALSTTAFSQRTLSMRQEPKESTLSGSIGFTANLNYRFYEGRSNSIVVDITLTATKDDYLYFNRKKYTSQQLGADIFSKLVIRKFVSFEADAYYNGQNLGTVVFDASSGCSNSDNNSPSVCTGQPMDNKNDGTGKSMHFRSLAWGEAKKVWLSGSLQFQNFRFANFDRMELYSPNPMLSDAVQKYETGHGGKTNNSANSNQNFQNNSTSNNKSSTTSTYNNPQRNTTTSSTTNNNTGKTDLEKYNDFLKQQQQTTQTFDNAAKQFTDLVNANTKTWAQRKAETEAKYEKEEAERKAKEEKENQEFYARQQKRSDLAIKQRDEFAESDFKAKDIAYPKLFKNKSLYGAWVNACKKGTAESLTAFLKSNDMEYFRTVATEMVNGWKYGKLNPNDYIELAISENNWTLTKYLLDNGANPSYIKKDPLGTYHSALQQFFAPLYKGEKELIYDAADRIELFKKLVSQGADPNAIYSDQNETEGRKACSDYIVRLILLNDYNGDLLKWLLDNNKLNSKTIEYALSYLDQQLPDLLQKNVSSAYASNYGVMFPDKHFKINEQKTWRDPIVPNGITLLDNLYIQAKYLYQKKSLFEGAIGKFDIKNSCYWTYSPTYNTTDYLLHKGGFWAYPNGAHLSYWRELQYTILSRATDKDQWYLHFLAKSLIFYHDEKDFDSREMLAQIVRLGVKPSSNELEDDFHKKKFSMIDYAKDRYKKDLVSYLKNDKNFVNVKVPVTTTVTTPETNSNNIPDNKSNTSTNTNVSNNSFPSIEAKEMTAEYDKIAEGKKGILIHLSFTVANMKAVTSYAGVYFEKKKGGQIDGLSADYKTQSGQLAVFKKITPGYDVTEYKDLQFFVPYSAINIGLFRIGKLKAIMKSYFIFDDGKKTFLKEIEFYLK